MSYFTESDRAARQDVQQTKAKEEGARRANIARAMQQQMPALKQHLKTQVTLQFLHGLSPTVSKTSAHVRIDPIGESSKYDFDEAMLTREIATWVEQEFTRIASQYSIEVSVSDAEGTGYTMYHEVWVSVTFTPPLD